MRTVSQIVTDSARYLRPNASAFYDHPLHIVTGEGVGFWDANLLFGTLDEVQSDALSRLTGAQLKETDQRLLNTDAHAHFLLLRAFANVGQIKERMDEATQRHRRFVETAKSAATQKLAA